MRFLTGVVWVSLAIFISCGGGSSTQAPAPPVPAPSSLTASYDATGLTYTLAWTDSTGTVDGYLVEASENNSSFTQLNKTPLPAAASGATFTLNSALPEGTLLSFRVRAVRSNQYSSYSNTADLDFILGPSQPGATTYADGVNLLWTQNSKLADHALVERASCDTSGNPIGGWTQVASVPLSSTVTIRSYQDSTVQELHTYIYRITNVYQKDASPISPNSLGITTTIFAPTQVNSTPIQNGVSLSWINASQIATQILVKRAPLFGGTQQLIANLPPSATGFQDTNLAFGTYSYSVQVTDGQNLSLPCILQGSTLNPPGSPILFQGGSVNLDSLFNPSYVAFAPGLQWEAAQYDRAAKMIHLPSGGSYPAWDSAAIPYVYPPIGSYYPVAGMLAMDASSFPHVVYASDAGSTPSAPTSTILHSWFNGSWQTETVLANTSGSVTSFALDKSGGLYLVTKDLHYLTKSSGAWTQESLDPTGAFANPANVTQSPLQMDTAGNPHLLIQDSTSTYEMVRSSAGAWTRQPLPFSAGGTGFWSDAADAWILYPGANSSDPTLVDFWALQKSGGTWQNHPLLLSSGNAPAPSVYTGLPFTAGPTAAMSPDGSRIAMVQMTAHGYLLFACSNQSWTVSLVPFQLPYNPLDGGTHAPPQAFVAFDSLNRLHVHIDISDFYEQHWP